MPAINLHSYPYVKDNCLFGSGFKHLPSAPRRTWPSSRIPASQIEMDSGWPGHSKRTMIGCGNASLLCHYVSRWCRAGERGRSGSTHFHSRGGGRKWRRRRHSQADVRSPYFCRAICTGTADLCTTHNARASLIVSAAGDNKTESLNLLFTIHEISKRNMQGPG